MLLYPNFANIFYLFVLHIDGQAKNDSDYDSDFHLDCDCSQCTLEYDIPELSEKTSP